MDHQNSRLTGTYKLSKYNGNTSKEGKDYSKLLGVIDESLEYVTEQRTKLGSIENRLRYTINSLNYSSQNLT